MPLRRQFLYYQLLKFSAQSDIVPKDVLEEAVDDLVCCSSDLSQSDVSLRVQLDSLLKTSQAVHVLSNPEIKQMCMEVKHSLQQQSRSLTLLLLERALEAAGVAYSIQHFAVKYQLILESRLCKTQGLSHLLQAHGEQVLKDVASYIDEFRIIFVQRARAAQATLQGLIAIKRANSDAYHILAKHMTMTRGVSKTLRRFKTLSLSLDGQDIEDMDTPKGAKLLLQRRAFSVDVQAGLDVQI